MVHVPDFYQGPPEWVTDHVRRYRETDGEAGQQDRQGPGAAVVATSRSGGTLVKSAKSGAPPRLASLPPQQQPDRLLLCGDAHSGRNSSAASPALSGPGATGSSSPASHAAY